MNHAGTLVPLPVEGCARPLKRLGAAFGRRFFLLLVVGLMWLGPAFAEPRFAYGMLAWDVLVLLAWLVDYRQLPPPQQLTMRRSWREPLSLSVGGQVELTLENSGARAVHAAITDDLPPDLRPQLPEMELSVAARRESSGSYDVRPSRRGDIEVGDAYLRYESPLRLAQRWARVPLAQKVRVYPDLEEAQRHLVYLVRSRQIELEKRYTRIRGIGREFESLREYRHGDEFRDICWTASARRGKLVSRIYQVERSQTVWVVVDCGRLMRARIAGLSKLDYATTAALSLAEVALYSGDRVGLMAYGRGVRRRVLPARGNIHLRQFLDGLATLDEESSEADHLHAAGALLSTQKRRSLVIWITDLAETAMTPDVVEAAAQMMPRHLVLFAVIGQPDLGTLAAKEPETVAEMYQTTAAQEVVLRRELLLARLRQQGVLAMEAPSRTLATALVNSYLEVKERSRL